VKVAPSGSARTVTRTQGASNGVENSRPPGGGEVDGIHHNTTAALPLVARSSTRRRANESVCR
jgi:hypothetical protein